jgi:hypothetical protein
MQYSLLNRFRGVLLGSFIGEILGSGDGLGRVLGKATLTPPKPDDTQPSQLLLPWSQVAACGTESLIRCGRLDLEDWVLYSGMTQPSLLLLKATASSSEAGVATLPIALFFHEDQAKLRQKLLEAAELWQHDSKADESVLAVAFAIALALTEKLDFATLIPRTLAYLGTSPAPLVQQLEQVQTLLEQGAGLDRTLTQLHQGTQRKGTSLGRPYLPIALAFYCFLSTPEDFRLCVTRAARSGYQSQTTATLTGALAGAYNSIIGLPVGWCLAANRITTSVQRLQQVERLFAVWSGAYDVSTADQCHRVAVAAPRVIQPR